MANHDPYDPFSKPQPAPSPTDEEIEDPDEAEAEELIAAHDDGTTVDLDDVVRLLGALKGRGGNALRLYRLLLVIEREIKLRAAPPPGFPK